MSFVCWKNWIGIIMNSLICIFLGTVVGYVIGAFDNNQDGMGPPPPPPPIK